LPFFGVTTRKTRLPLSGEGGNGNCFFHDEGIHASVLRVKYFFAVTAWRSDMMYRTFAGFARACRKATQPQGQAGFAQQNAVLPHEKWFLLFDAHTQRRSERDVFHALVR
ncbi:MAG: hypothetical protein LBC37_07805, partial [Zoogloeaceae bacterium]|nr:hypothetical protein [Zoogloeaceae bacterium]